VSKRRRRPPLADLHAFEAAARHLSFTRAANELSVTQGAVSQRIRALEDALGVRLFQRLTRALALTPEGADLAAAVRDGLARIDEGLDAVERRRRAASDAAAGAAARPLLVSVLSSFAGKWLLPRLAHFRALHPEIDVTILADDRLADIAAGEVDLGIRFGGGIYPGLRSTRLLGDAAFPVCRPRLLAAADGPPLRTPDNLVRHTLLHDATAERDASGCTWADWARSVGIGLRCETGPRFSQTHLAIQAAIDGMGIAIGRATLVADDISAGRLVQPFRHAVPTTYAYHIVRPAERRPMHPGAGPFADWLHHEAALWQAPHESR
jgi:LysR family glycine cleavage system transcriptional activator